MALRIIWSPQALANLRQIDHYISQDSEEKAAIFCAEVIEVVESIPAFPDSGRLVPEFNKEDLREKVHKGYRIVYQIQPKVIEVVTIRRGSKRMHDIDRPEGGL